MWRTVTGDRPGGSGTSASSAPGPELTAPGFLTHDSPLLGLLSAVSRPAVSFLQRYLRPVKRDFLEPDAELLRRFEDILPPPQLHSLPWFNLSELGLQSPGDMSPGDMSPQTGLPVSAPAVVTLVPGPGSGSKSWWGGLWSGTEEEQVRCSGVTLCAETRTVAFIQERPERTRLPADKGAFSPGLSNLPNLPRLRLIQSLGAVRGDTCALTPDQDHGYSSLEEEQLVAKARLLSALPGLGSAEEPREELQETEEQLPVLQCENKTIAFIMGCPCSDDSGSEDSEEEEEEEEDDGFDSDCSSEVSGSEEDEEEFDSETERLWSSLCQSNDPYNPRNFTAKLGSAPRPIPRPGSEPGPGPEEDQSSPGSCASSVASSASSASSSSWDEASDAEEQNLKLLDSFCSSDPYSPLNFQAPIRTKTRPGPGTEPLPDPKPEEHRVRTISECSQSSSRGKKKVRFCPDVQVFPVGSEERRGQWEEFARDRARFLKRCRDVEQVLSPCLQSEHRRRVYRSVSQSQARAEPEGRGTGQSQAEEE